LAEDVAQAVFLALSQKAGWLAKREGGIEGWLHEAARFASANCRRARMRQARHEQEAGAMRDFGENEDAKVRGHMEMEIEPALGRLRKEHREAILLRFYRGMSHAEAAGVMGVSEEAAKKRVTRAVDRLREVLGRRGVNVPAVGIGAGMASFAVRPAPSGFAARVMDGVKGKAASASVLRITKGILRRRLVMGVKIAAVIGVVAMAAGVPLVMVSGVGRGSAATAVAADAPSATTQDASQGPLDALKRFNHALSTSDVKELGAAMHAGTPEDQAMLASMQDVMTAVADLRKVLVAKFGEPATARLRQLSMGSAPEQSLEGAVVTIHGETATIELPEHRGAPSFEMVRVGDAWKFDVGQLLPAEQRGAEGRKAFSEQMKRQLEQLKGVRADVESGEMTTVEEVRERLQKRK
jgi:RNA polymerase sigma factor (sigma-70 family)